MSNFKENFKTRTPICILEGVQIFTKFILTAGFVILIINYHFDKISFKISEVHPPIGPKRLSQQTGLMDTLPYNHNHLTFGKQS